MAGFFERHKEQKKAETLEAAKGHEKKGNYLRAAVCYEAAGANDKSKEMFALAGDHNAKEGNHATAITSYKKAGMYDKVVELYLSHDKPNMAQAEYEKALKLYEKEGRFEDAAKMAEKMGEKDKAESFRKRKSTAS